MGVSGDALLIALGPLTSAAAWWATGLPREVLEAWAAAVVRTAAGVALAARSLLAGAAKRLGAGDAEDVTLGEVSEMVDVVRLGLSAGLSFDAALGIYCEHRRGLLARRMEAARLSWQIGIEGRERALMGVARDTGLRALESFAASVGQALALGSPLADTLESLSAECRAAHRSEVERQIERAPVKLLIPTGTLILPALLLAIMGPLLAAGGMI